MTARLRTNHQVCTYERVNDVGDDLCMLGMNSTFHLPPPVGSRAFRHVELKRFPRAHEVLSRRWAEPAMHVADVRPVSSQARGACNLPLRSELKHIMLAV